ncbi:hypothetical protein NUSPORA_01650 [Nucleospora cyclopteri]
MLNIQKTKNKQSHMKENTQYNKKNISNLNQAVQETEIKNMEAKLNNIRKAQVEWKQFKLLTNTINKRQTILSDLLNELNTLNDLLLPFDYIDEAVKVKPKLLKFIDICELIPKIKKAIEQISIKTVEIDNNEKLKFDENKTYSINSSEINDYVELGNNLLIKFQKSAILQIFEILECNQVDLFKQFLSLLNFQLYDEVHETYFKWRKSCIKKKINTLVNDFSTHCLLLIHSEKVVYEKHFGIDEFNMKPEKPEPKTAISSNSRFFSLLSSLFAQIFKKISKNTLKKQILSLDSMVKNQEMEEILYELVYDYYGINVERNNTEKSVVIQ